MESSPAGSHDVLKNALYQTSVGVALRQQQDRQEPARARSHGGHIVGIDVDRVPAQVFGGKGDGIAFRHQVAVPHIDDRRIFAEARPHQQAGITSRDAGEQPVEHIRRQFSGRIFFPHGLHTALIVSFEGRGKSKFQLLWLQPRPNCELSA